MTDSVTGMVPTDERDTKASEIAGQAPEKNWRTESPLRRSSTG